MRMSSRKRGRSRGSSGSSARLSHAQLGADASRFSRAPSPGLSSRSQLSPGRRSPGRESATRRPLSPHASRSPRELFARSAQLELHRLDTRLADAIGAVSPQRARQWRHAGPTGRDAPIIF